MPNKRKLLKRKLRRTRYFQVEREPKPSPTSRSDALISSMEALIRKMSMTPSAPSTVITQPAQIQPQHKELSKEEIMADIAKQRELDMLKNQVHYMYNRVDDDIAARRDKGEVMARMVSKGTNIKPKKFGIDEDDDLFKVQRSAAKSRLQVETLGEHEKLDENEAHRREREIFRDTILDRIESKLSNAITSPPKIALSNSGVSSFESKASSPKDEFPVPTTPRPLKALGKGKGTPPKGYKLKFPLTKEAFNEEPLAHTTPTDNQDLAVRKANDLVDESFEQVLDTTAKMKIQQIAQEANEEKVREERQEAFDLLLKQRDINNKIYDRMGKILEENGEVSPDKKLEKALFNSKRRNELEDSLHKLNLKIIQTKQKIANAEHERRHSRDQEYIDKITPKIAYNKELLDQMNKARDNMNKELIECGPKNIEALRQERKGKMFMKIDELNDKLSKDEEIRHLIQERSRAGFEYANRNRDFISTMDTDPNHVQEALENQRAYIEKFVNDKASADGEVSTYY